MPNDRWIWDATATLEALGAASVALWLWEPGLDRMSFTGPTRGLGLGPLAPECSAAALRALTQPQDRAVAAELLSIQPPGSEIELRLRILGGEQCLWRGVWLEDGVRAAGMVAAETRFSVSGFDGLTGLLDRRTFVARAQERLKAPGDNILVVADLDRFRRLNEALGHERADLVLAALGARLSDILGVPVGERPHADLVVIPLGMGDDALAGELPDVVGVLQDQPGVAPVEQQVQRGAHQRAQQPRLEVLRGEDVAHAGQRVDDQRHPCEPRRHGAVEHRLHRHLVDDVRSYPAEHRHQLAQRRQLAQRVGAAPRPVQRQLQRAAWPWRCRRRANTASRRPAPTGSPPGRAAPSRPAGTPQAHPRSPG